MAKLGFKHRFDYWKSYVLSTPLESWWTEKVKWEEKTPLLQQTKQKLNGSQVSTVVHR